MLTAPIMPFEAYQGFGIARKDAQRQIGRSMRIYAVFTTKSD